MTPNVARSLAYPPTWLVGLAVAVTAICLLVAVVGLHRNVYDADVAREQGGTLAVVLSIVASTQLLMDAGVGYVPTVIWGTAIGYAFAQTLLWCIEQAQADREPSTSSTDN